MLLSEERTKVVWRTVKNVGGMETRKILIMSMMERFSQQRWMQEHRLGDHQPCCAPDRRLAGILDTDLRLHLASRGAERGPILPRWLPLLLPLLRPPAFRPHCFWRPAQPRRRSWRPFFPGVGGVLAGAFAWAQFPGGGQRIRGCTPNNAAVGGRISPARSSCLCWRWTLVPGVPGRRAALPNLCARGPERPQKAGAAARLRLP